MSTPRLLLPFAVRASGVFLVAFASLQLALRTADAIFIAWQGQSGAESVPAILGWLAVVAAGLALYRVPVSHGPRNA